MNKVYTKAEHSFFDELLSFLISVCCLPVGLNFFRKMLDDSKTIPPWEKDQGALIKGKSNVTNQQIRFIPHVVFAQLWERKWPDKFELEYQPLDESASTIPSPERMRRDLTYTLEMFAGTYVLFWDKIEKSIHTKYSSDTTNWPDAINFARVIRNSFAHGNKIEIRNKNFPTINWKSISVDYSSNGQVVLFDLLGIADIVVLMEEIDSLI